MRVWAALLLVPLAACLQPATQTCDDGSVCPIDKVCLPAGGCADAAQLAACEGIDDGDPCQLPGIGDGACVGGACIVVECGNGVTEPGEACDDPAHPDACNPSCAMPTCGDGFTQAGEDCDEGAGNADDQACTTRCLFAFCGDGFVRAGLEQCDDLLLDADDQACTSTCQDNVCGDGLVWAGVEACDNGNTVSGDGCRADCRKLETCGDLVLDEGEVCDDGNLDPADRCDACAFAPWSAAAVIGGGLTPLSVSANEPVAVAVDVAGNVYVADTELGRVYRISADGAVMTRIAGTSPGFSGDGGPATSAQLRPGGLAVDGLGNVFVSDTVSSRVRRIDAATGIITTFAGSGTFGIGGDGQPATAAQLGTPTGLAIDGLGTLYIADEFGHVVRMVDTAGLIWTVAGTGGSGSGGDGGLATAAELCDPHGVALAGHALYIADICALKIRKVDLDTGLITAFAGGGASSLDGIPATSAHLVAPDAVAVDAAGDVYLTDFNAERVRKVSGGIITTIAGFGESGFSGDGGPATAARLHFPYAVAVSPEGDVYIADLENSRVRRVHAGEISTFAGTGGLGTADDGRFATSAKLTAPYGVAFGPDGSIYFTDEQQLRVRKVDPEGVITTIAGTGGFGDTGDGGPALAATFVDLRGIAVTAAGDVLVADAANHRVRKISAATGVISAFAGNGNADSGGDGGPAVDATLDAPTGLAVDAAGNAYITDAVQEVVRKVNASDGKISTVAGKGSPGFDGDGGDALLAQLLFPQAVAVNAAGDLYIADAGNQRIRRVDHTTGVIDTVVGGGTPVGGVGDGLVATAAALDTPYGVAVNAAGDVFVIDPSQHRLRRVDATTQIITTVVGIGFSGSDGDGGLATAARLGEGYGLAVGATGDVVYTDHLDARVRRVHGGTITTIAGAIDPEGTGPIDTAVLADPRAISYRPGLTLIAAGSAGVLEAVRDVSTLEVVAGRYPQNVSTGALARFRDHSIEELGGVASDPAGTIYVTETSGDRILAIHVVDPADENTWTIAPFAAGVPLHAPTGLHLSGGTLYVADTGNHVIRAIDTTTEEATTIAGTEGVLGQLGDTGAATSALLYAPEAITTCGGDLFVADTGNHRVRRIHAGTITTVLGDGVAASSGEGLPAHTFPVDTPLGLACDSFGNLFVTSSSTVRLVAADDLGVVDGSGVVQTLYAATPALPTPCLSGIATVDDRTLLVTDACTGMLVELTR